MASPVGSRRSMIVSLALTIIISFGALIATLSMGWSPKLGLDLAGGLSVVYKPATQTSTANLQEVVTILSNRVNGLGVSGAQVNLQGKNVVVSVPGVQNARQILADIGQTAQLLFRPVICQTSIATKKAKTVTSLPACGAGYVMSAANLAVDTNTGLPTNNIPLDPQFASIASTSPQVDNPKHEVLLPGLGNKSTRYVLGPSVLTGHSIKKAIAQQDQVGAWVVNYTLTGSGSPLWDQVAQQNFHAELAIELDGGVHVVRRSGTDLRILHRVVGEESRARHAVRFTAGATGGVDDHDRLTHARPQRVGRRSRCRSGRARALVHDPLLPRVGPRHRAGPRRHRRALVGDHLLARSHRSGADLQPGGRGGGHFFLFCYSRYFHRVLFTIQKRKN